jgi:site-specific recombinase XerD
MKEKLITGILASMAAALSQEQLDELNRVLSYNLHNVEITQIKNAGAGEKPGNDALLEAFISAKRIEGCSDKSLGYYNSVIRHLFARVDKPVHETATNDLRCYLSGYQTERGCGRVTIDNIRRIFSSFFGWLEDEDYILKSPVRRIHKVKIEKTVRDTLSDEELELLRDSCENMRDLAMIDMLSSTGMRAGELVRLNRDDINFNERECVVFGKGSSERVVYFDARAKIHLLDYLNERADDNPALFVSFAEPNRRLMIGGVETRLREIGKRANLLKVQPHKFRRTLATRAIDKGMPIEQVQRMLGHIKIDTTMRYAMVNQTNVKNSHRKYIG